MATGPVVSHSIDSGLRLASPADEFLHGVGAQTDFTAVETSYLGFSVPGAAINVEVFHLFRPVLGVVAGGVLIFRGESADPLHAAYVDYRAHLPHPDPAARTLRFATGLEIEVVAPLSHLELRFRAPDGSASFDVSVRGVMPAIGPVGRGHFCQAVRTSGTLTLGAERHEVDGWFTRDRSWSELRGEEPHPIPPIGWGAAVFNDDLAFHFVGFDSAELSEQAGQWGYVWAAGEARSVTRLRPRTERGSDGMAPSSVEIELLDSSGEYHVLTGISQARLPFSVWPNMVTEFTQMRWQYADVTGYGDFQDVQFPAFRRQAGSKRTGKADTTRNGGVDDLDR